jgi:uncharacterized protein involved in exopolysaccharide biosynthesis
MENAPSAGIAYLRAAHELQYRQTLLDLLIRQYDAARMDESKQAAVIQVVEPAIEPDRKSSPQRAVILLLSTFGGCFVGCIIALLLWSKELVQFDPMKAQQLEELRCAFKWRERASS